MEFYYCSPETYVVLTADQFVACVAADSFPFSGGAEIEQANEKRASEGARLGILPLFRSFPPVRERLEKERKRLLRRLINLLGTMMASLNNGGRIATFV